MEDHVVSRMGNSLLFLEDKTKVSVSIIVRSRGEYHEIFINTANIIKAIESRDDACELKKKFSKAYLTDIVGSRVFSLYTSNNLYSPKDQRNSSGVLPAQDQIVSTCIGYKGDKTGAETTAKDLFMDFDVLLKQLGI